MTTSVIASPGLTSFSESKDWGMNLNAFLKGKDLVAIISDYDRTLTDDALMLCEPALAALGSFRKQFGTKVIIASGRQMDFLLSVLMPFQIFDAFVAENGCLIHFPGSSTTIAMGEDMSEAKAAFRESSIPVEEGQILISTKRIFEETAMDLIHQKDLKVDLQYNRDSLMIAPAGSNKASGVREALRIMDLSHGGLVCIGDGENDLPLFEIADVRVAPQDAVHAVKLRADIICTEPNCLGVASFLNDLLENLSGLKQVSFSHEKERLVP